MTGGAGFVGSSLCEKISKDHDVYSLDNYSIGTKDNHIKGVNYIKGNVSQILNIDIDTDFDVCFHFAGLSRIQPSFLNPTETFMSNTLGTQMVLEWCRLNNTKMIYSGSSSRHYNHYQSPYATCKYLGEELCKMYREVFKLDVNITRFYNVYGPKEITKGEWAAVIGLWRNQIKEGEPITIVGNGEQKRDFTHVDDIIDALVAIMDGNHYGWDFELGRGKNISVNEVAKMMDITPVYKDSKPGEARHTLNIDNTAYDVLDWEPKINLEEYLKK